MPVFVNMTTGPDNLRPGDLSVIDNKIVTITNVLKTGGWEWIVEYSYTVGNGVVRYGARFCEESLTERVEFPLIIVQNVSHA